MRGAEGSPRNAIRADALAGAPGVSEVVAMMHLVRFSGVDVAAAFNERLIRRMQDKAGIREYLQEDYE